MRTAKGTSDRLAQSRRIVGELCCGKSRALDMRAAGLHLSSSDSSWASLNRPAIMSAITAPK